MEYHGSSCSYNLDSVILVKSNASLYFMSSFLFTYFDFALKPAVQQELLLQQQ